MLCVLEVLRGSELGEWEILELLHSRYGSTPAAREFRRVAGALIGEGYVIAGGEGKERKLRISDRGLVLAQRLEEEYRAIVSAAGSLALP